MRFPRIRFYRQAFYWNPMWTFKKSWLWIDWLGVLFTVVWRDEE